MTASILRQRSLFNQALKESSHIVSFFYDFIIETKPTITITNINAFTQKLLQEYTMENGNSLRHIQQT